MLKKQNPPWEDICHCVAESSEKEEKKRKWYQDSGIMTKKFHKFLLTFSEKCV